MSTLAPRDEAQLEGNLRHFIIFRVFFHARFYYPVFTILFLDYGLTLEQFSILNMVWALTVVLAEVPSGALSDVIGRKRLIVFAASLMVLEMGLLTFVPIRASPLLFTVFLINRICSGLAEAAASGSDEALAYDSLVLLGREDQWARLLDKTSRYVSIGFFVHMIIGAASYDYDFVNTIVQAINPAWHLPKELVIRFPVILTLITGCIVFFTTVRMKEVHQEKKELPERGQTILHTISLSFSQVIKAASWTFNHRFVLFVILAALILDSVGRQFVILASEYYRIIHIPPKWFGFIGAGMSLIGYLNARFSRYLVTHHSPFFNFLVLCTILMTGLVGIMLTIPWFGVFFAIGAFAMMGMVAFQSSYYINNIVDSAHRATVLSFRGLALNLGLGFASLLYTGLIATLKSLEEQGIPPEQLQEMTFVDSLKAFPLYFLVLLVILFVLARIFFRNPQACFQVPKRN